MRDTPTVRPVTALVGIVLVWSLSTLFFGGDIGKLSDDYTQNAIDPATGRAEWLGMPWTINGFFWRPLHIAVVYALGTAFASHYWIVHAITALAFLGVVLALWRLVIVLTGRTGVATAVALLYCSFPANREVMLWPAAISYSLAAIVFAALCLATIRAARDGRVGRLAAHAAVAGIVIPCLNEQPAAALPSIAILYVAATPQGARGRAAARAVLPVATALAGTALYLALYLATVPDSHRGAAGSFVAPGAVAARIATVATDVGDELAGSRLRTAVEGGFAFGWPALRSFRGIAWFVAFAATAWWAWRRRWARRTPLAPSGAGFGWWTLAFGAGLFLVSWLPVVLIAGQTVPPRVFTFPLLGLAIAGAAMIERIGVALADRPRTRAVARTVVVPVVVVASIGSAVALVGWQRLMRETYSMDRAIFAQLATLVPEPPPVTVFIPLENDSRVASTGVPGFDGALAGGGLATPWSADRLLRESYPGRDLHIAAFNPWMRNVGDANAWELQVRVIGGPFERGPAYARVAWHMTVPFVVDRDGTVKLVERVAIAHLEEQTAEASPPLTQGLHGIAAAHREPRFVLRLPFAKRRRPGR